MNDLLIKIHISLRLFERNLCFFLLNIEYDIQSILDKDEELIVCHLVIRMSWETPAGQLDYLDITKKSLDLK